MAPDSKIPNFSLQPLWNVVSFHACPDPVRNDVCKKNDDKDKSFIYDGNDWDYDTIRSRTEAFLILFPQTSAFLL